MRITVLAIGRLRAPYLENTEHYTKLLCRYAKLELLYVKDEDALMKRVPKDTYICLLDCKGRSFSSVDFSRFIEERQIRGRDICFLVGGAKGFERPDRIKHDLKLSFGPATLPHQLALVVLLEQLYRAHKILAGEPYHY